jgi:hypothetical protein
VKPPYNEPPRITQAPDINRPAEEGLEREQVVSVGRKPVPLIEICEPIRALPELNAITGSDSMFVRMIVSAETNKTPMKSRLTINLNETWNILCGCKELMVALHCVETKRRKCSKPKSAQFDDSLQTIIRLILAWIK